MRRWFAEGLGGAAARRAGAGAVLALAALLAGCEDGSVGQMWGEPAQIFRVSGSIAAEAGTIADRDVNDLNAPLHPDNNTTAAAQPLPNPATVGGYVNTKGKGAEGRTFADGDPDDYFVVDLAAGQDVVLTGADDAASLPKLELLDAAGEVVASGTAPTGELTASVRAPAGGTYYVHVQAKDGTASGYVLTVGHLSGAVDAGLDPGDDFVPGEVIVTLRGSAAAKGAAGDDAEGLGALGLETKAGGGKGRPRLMRLAAEGPRAAAARQLEAGLPTAHRRKVEALPAEERLKVETVLAVKALRARPDVLRADLNYRRRAFAVPSDPSYALQWHYPLIHLPQAWDLVAPTDAEREAKTARATVAVIDTGVLLGHPDLQDKLLRHPETGGVVGYDFISDAQSAADGDGIDPNPGDPGDRTFHEPSSSFHGTHVAGTVGAATGNGEGVAGVGWGVRIMPIRALGVGGVGDDYDILQGMLYAAGLPNDSGTVPFQRADVINLSLGGARSSETVEEAVGRIRAAGVIVVASAGNYHTSTPSFPAAYPGVVSVSAVDARKQLAGYSNFGPTIDVAAPGGYGSDAGKVWSTVGDDRAGPIEFTYGPMAGTSMAAPHVAGVAALMAAVIKDAHPDDPSWWLTPAQFDADLRDDLLTEDLGTDGKDQVFGHGLIDAFKAVIRAYARAEVLVPDVALLTVSPSAVDLQFDRDTATVSVGNAGTGPLEVTWRVAGPDAAWLAVTPPDDPNGLGTYLLRATREGLAPGTYLATLEFTPSAGEVATVQVLLRAGTAADPPPDAGHHYIFLFDVATGEITARAQADAANGRYEFSFPSVPEGTYWLEAGTDLDNDLVFGNFGDPGEAAGSYPTGDLPEIVTVTRDVSSLEFRTSFPVPLPALGTSGAGRRSRPAEIGAPGAGGRR